MNWKLLVRISVFICFILSVVSLVILVYLSRQLHTEISILQKKIVKLDKQRTSMENEISNQFNAITVNAINVNNAFTRLDGAEAKVEVLDSSMHPDKKRRQRLLQARDAILGHLHNGRSLAVCGTLSPWDVYRIAGWFVDYTDRYGVELSLALAVARRESFFCQKAVSAAGAVGIMQIMNATAGDLSTQIGVRLNRHRSEDNIRMGIYYLGQLTLDFKGDTELAVKSYNMGPHNVKKVIAGEFRDYFNETKEYWIFVEKYQKEFKEAGL